MEYRDVFLYAQGGTPTRKALRPTDFKSVVYSNFTTWAPLSSKQKNNKARKQKYPPVIPESERNRYDVRDLWIEI